jgi:hypothetical protein
MHLNRLRSRKSGAGLLVLAGALIAIIAASSAARNPAIAPAGQAAALSSQQGE